MKSFGIIGHPVAHSLSPKIFNTAFSALKIDATYEAFDILPEQLGAFIQEEKNLNKFSGLSVTVPHKEKIIEYLDEVSADARKIGAVNTIIKVGNKLRGENTDWIGVQMALGGIKNIKDKSFLLIGAGGVARAVVFALKEMGVNKITVWNRSKERGLKLAKDFEVNFSDSIPDKSDVIINCTSIGLEKGERVPISDPILKNSKVVFDVVYGETDLIQRAKSLGVKTIDGEEMLLGQAFEQFRLFTDGVAFEG